MSRQNKVNPGMYTQRGRLTQDDAARELRKQRAIGSEHTWQPANTKAPPRPAAHGDANREPERAADNESMVETSPRVETRSARRVTRNTSTKAAPSNTTAKAAKAETPATRKSTKATGKARTGKARTTAMKPTTTKPTRTAVLARNAGGRVAAPRPTATRRKR